VVAWGGRLPSRRRAVTGSLSGLGIVLVSNLGGSTGALLSLDKGKLAGKLHLDVLYPVNGFKRCLDGQNGFEFVFPATWLADQRMYRRNAERSESMRGLDPPSTRPQKRTVAEPVAAFGPPGSSGELNVSVIVAPIEQSFTLASLGNPREAGAKFLSTSIAPEGSPLTATLLDASERKDEAGQIYYYLEYIVERPGSFFRHNVSTYAVRSGTLYTLNAQCAETSWEANKEALRKMAASFQVSTSRPVGAAAPRRR